MTLYEILDVVWYAFTAFIFLPIGLGIRYWYNLTSQERWLVRLLLALLILEIIATILRYNYIRNHFMNYFRTLAVLWGGAFFFEPTVRLGNWPTRIAGILTILIPVEVLLWVGFNHINTLTVGTAWLLLAVYGFRCLALLFNLPDSVSLRQNPYLYVHLGFLILGFFSSCTRFFANYFIETSVDLYFFSDTLAVMMNAFAYGLFAMGIWQIRSRVTIMS